MGVFGLELQGLRVECIVMMERPSRTSKVKRGASNVYTYKLQQQELQLKKKFDSLVTVLRVD